MESKRYGSEIVLRLDEGDELNACVEQACREHKVRSARVSGIGALKQARLRVLNQSGDGFVFRELCRNMEIISITGNVTADGEGLMVHLHLSAADDSFQLVGGHVASCVITNTAELWITETDGVLRRAETAEGLLRRIEFSS